MARNFQWLRIARVIIIFLVAFLYANTALADVLILTSESKGAQKFTKSLKKSLHKFDPKVITSIDRYSDKDIIINLTGNKLSEDSTEANIISIVPSHLNLNSSSGYPVFVFQISPELIIAQITKDFPNQRIGYLYSDPSDPIALAAEKSKTNTFITEMVTGNVYSHLRRLKEIGQIDIMLIGNDHRIFNSRNIRFILEDFYRNHIPVASLSSSLLSAGASVAYVPSYDDMANMLNEYILSHQLNTSSEVPIIYSQKGIKQTNSQMLKRYNISISEGWK